MTTYILDTATPLTMVLSETTAGETTQYWHALDTLAQSDGTTTEYFAYDGLGSVRQLVDETGSVGLAQTFDAYGNGYAKAGSAQSTLGYTGEQTDSNGFVFLRARYYQPGMGRFTQMDPSRQERNVYQYSSSNPTNFSDPTGLWPTKEEILKGNYEYSCNCAWIDWTHFGLDGPLDLLELLEEASVRSESDYQLWGLTYPLTVFEPKLGTYNLQNDIALVDYNSPLLKDADGPLKLAVSIFMSANEKFETSQGLYGAPITVVDPRLAHSYFAEEDLVSDFLGFYAAVEFSKQYRELGIEGAKQEIRKVCGSLGSDDATRKAASLLVFRDAYDNGRKFKSGWTTWSPRLDVPLPQYAPHFSSAIQMASEQLVTQCSRQNRCFPSEIAALTRLRIEPQVGGSWMWLSQRNDYGSMTGYFDIVAVGSHTSPPFQVRLLKLTECYP